MDKKTFKSVIKTYLKLVLEKIIAGGKHDFHYQIGTIGIYRMDRNFKKLMPDWNESNKLKAKLLEEGKQLYNKETGEGEQWLVYHTDPYFYGILWKRARINGTDILKNASFYTFEVFARTRRAIAQAIRNNEEAILLYNYTDNITNLLKQGKLKKAV